MSTVQTTVNVNPECCSQTPGSFSVRVWYKNQQDAGHLYGSFATKEAAERCLQIIAARADVERATIEEAV